MSLLTSEVQRLRYELGFNVLSVGAEPYISYVAVFDQVVQAYLNAGATTTSSTSVTAATTSTPVALTLTDATGFAAGDRVAVDVDARQETATIQSVSGSDITVLLSKTHSGSYPVTVEGGEVIVRQILRRIDEISGDAGQIVSATSTAGLKRAEDVEFFGNTGSNVNQGSGRIAELRALRMYWRDELASVVGVPNAWRLKMANAQSSALY